MVNKYFKVGEIVKKAITKKKPMTNEEFHKLSGAEQTSYWVGRQKEFSKKRRIESFKKTMAAKKKRREYEKSPAGQEENRKRIEKMKKAHARRRWLNENVRDQ